MIDLPSAFFVAGTDTEVGKTYVSVQLINLLVNRCLLYTSPSPRDRQKSRMPSSA